LHCRPGKVGRFGLGRFQQPNGLWRILVFECLTSEQKRQRIVGPVLGHLHPLLRKRLILVTCASVLDSDVQTFVKLQLAWLLGNRVFENLAFEAIAIRILHFVYSCRVKSLVQNLAYCWRRFATGKR
jgi:hypothetical protein